METITIKCTNNGKTKEAEVLNKTDKYLKVVLPGTQIVLELFRDDLNSEYTDTQQDYNLNGYRKHKI